MLFPGTKYSKIHVYYCLSHFPVKLLISFSSIFGNMHSKYGGTYRRKAKFLLFHNSFQFLYIQSPGKCVSCITVSK